MGGKWQSPGNKKEMQSQNGRIDMPVGKNDANMHLRVEGGLVVSS